MSSDAAPAFLTSAAASGENAATPAAADVATADLCDAHHDKIASGEVRVLTAPLLRYGGTSSCRGRVVTVRALEDNTKVREALESGGAEGQREGEKEGEGEVGRSVAATAGRTSDSEAGGRRGRGEGKVLVVDGGGSRRCALLGGNLGVLAEREGWAGVLVWGCVRDVAELKRCRVDVRALGSTPVKSNKRGTGERDVPLLLDGGVRVCPGDWCYADLDGVLFSSSELTLPAV